MPRADWRAGVSCLYHEGRSQVAGSGSSGRRRPSSHLRQAGADVHVMNEVNDQPDEESAPPDGVTRVAGEADETQAGAEGLVESSALSVEERQIAATRSQSDV